jgi:integrase/recombinase XerD
MPEEKRSVPGRHERAVEWLRLGLPGRVPQRPTPTHRLAECLETRERKGADPLTACWAHIGVYVRELTERLSRRGVNVVAID